MQTLLRFLYLKIENIAMQTRGRQTKQMKTIIVLLITLSTSGLSRIGSGLENVGLYSLLGWVGRLDPCPSLVRRTYIQ